MEKIWKILVGILVAILLVIGYFWTMDIGAHMTGLPHPDFDHMLISGPNQLRTTPGIWAALFGSLCVVLSCTILFIGVRKRKKFGPALLPMTLASIGFVLAFAVLFYLDFTYEPMGKSGYLLGYPPATAWMLFIVWPYAALFSFIYVRKFHSWILTDEDMEKFKSLLRSQQE